MDLRPPDHRRFTYQVRRLSHPICRMVTTWDSMVGAYEVNNRANQFPTEMRICKGQIQVLYGPLYKLFCIPQP